MEIKDPVWLRLSEETNALDYLEQAYYFIRRTARDDIAWKWVILALHGALYGFAICACRGSDSRSVVHTTKRGKERLIGSDEALKRCQNSGYMGMTIYSKHLELSQQQKKSIDALKKEFRNQFEHYIPCQWSIDLIGMPDMAIDVLDVIHFLALETGNFIDLTEEQKERIGSIVADGKRILTESKLCGG